MKLKATKSFSGVLGSAGVGRVFEVSDEIGELMQRDHYPVEVVADEGKRANSRRRAKSPARS